MFGDGIDTGLQQPLPHQGGSFDGRDDLGAPRRTGQRIDDPTRAGGVEQQPPSQVRLSCSFGR